MMSFTLSGLCLEYDFRALILTGAGADDVAHRVKWPILAQGAIPLQIGVALFDRPFIFTPTHLITERQQTIEGEAVFDWLVDGCYRMPRSEVFGLDVHGQAAQVFARDIDIEESPIAVYQYGTWIAAVIEIDPTLGAEVDVLEQTIQLDRLSKTLRAFRTGPDVNLQRLL